MMKYGFVCDSIVQYKIFKYRYKTILENNIPTICVSITTLPFSPPFSLSLFALSKNQCKMARLDIRLSAKSIRAKSSLGRNQITNDRC